MGGVRTAHRKEEGEVPDGRIEFQRPTIVDHGTIAEHTFTRCGGEHTPKDYRDFPLDKFGECSEGHAS